MGEGFRAIIFLGQLILFFVGLLVLPFAIASHREQQRKRRHAMFRQARELGLKFDQRHNHRMAKDYRFLDHLDVGSDRYTLNMMNGDFQGHSVTLFDYHYRSDDGVWWWAPSWRSHEYFSFFILDLEKDFPELIITDENESLFSGIAEVFGFGDIDFESHEFSERFEVRGKSKKFAYDFCNAQMIDYLLDRPVIPIEVEKTSLAIGFRSCLELGEIEPHLTHLVKIRALMPNYLFG